MMIEMCKQTCCEFEVIGVRGRGEYVDVNSQIEECRLSPNATYANPTVVRHLCECILKHVLVIDEYSNLILDRFN